MNYETHPLVIFQILEAWNNRPVDSTDVIGVLLGTKTGNTVSLQDAYYLQHSVKQEPSLEIQCDMARVKTITSISSVLHPDYEILGWFTTYTELNELHRVIHTSFSNHFEKSDDFLLLTVDVTLQDAKLQPTLYTHQHSYSLMANPAAAAAEATTTTTTTSSTMTDAAAPAEDSLIQSPNLTLIRFAKQELRTVIPTQERLALNAMVFAADPTTTQAEYDGRLDCPVALRSNQDSVRHALVVELAQQLQAAINFVQGSLDGNETSQEADALLRQLTYLATNTPVLDYATSQAVFQASTDDLQLFTSLATLTTQIVSAPLLENKQ
eukprot:UN00903